MGWGEKAIEIRSVETGHLDGVFMHKRAQRLKFLCERNDKVNVLLIFSESTHDCLKTVPASLSLIALAIVFINATPTATFILSVLYF